MADPFHNADETDQPTPPDSADAPGSPDYQDAGGDPSEYVADQDTPVQLEMDLPCLGCGYNLRGQLMTGSCPECGKPVAESYRGDYFAYADVNWLRSLRKGLTLIILSTIVTIGLSMVLMVVSAVLMARMAQTTGSTFMIESTLALATMIVALTAGVLTVWGVFMLTEPEPDLAEREGETLRNVLRWGNVLVVGGGMILAVLSPAWLVVAHNVPNLNMTGNPVDMISGVASLLSIALMFVAMVFMRRLARRVPDASLVKQFGIVFWGSLIGYGALAVMGVVFVALMLVAGGAAPGPGGPGPGFAPSMFLLVVPLACFGGLAAMVFAVWYFVLVILLRSAIIEESSAMGGQPDTSPYMGR